MVKYNWALCKLNKAKGNYKEALENQICADYMSDSLQFESHSVSLIQTDHLFDEEIVMQNNIKNKNRHLFLLYSLSILAAIILVLFYFIHKKNEMNVALRNNLQQIYDELESSKVNLSNKFKEQEHLNNILQNHFNVVKNLLDSFFRNEKNINKFVSDFREAFTLAKFSKNFWQDILAYTDSKNNNVITRIKTLYPLLSEDEINFIALLSLNFSYIEITVCMGYTNYRYISTKCSRIAQKMGIECSLSDYINKLSTCEHN